MTYALLAESFPTARKRHRCIWCGQHIAPGEKYRREKSVYDGEMQDFKWHPECAEAQQEEGRETGEWEFSSYENERPAGVGAGEQGK